MKKILVLIMFLTLPLTAYATPSVENSAKNGDLPAGTDVNPYSLYAHTSPGSSTITPVTNFGPAFGATALTDNLTTHTCRSYWVGTTQSIDLYTNGAWVTFQNATAGTVLPVTGTGARITSGGVAPNAGDVNCLS